MLWPEATAGVTREPADEILGTTLLGTFLATGVPSGLDLPCTDDPELFFAEAPDDVEQAKLLCQGCRAKDDCLAGALQRREPWGVWGGELLLRGTIVPRKRPRGRPRKNDPVTAGPRTPAGSASNHIMRHDHSHNEVEVMHTLSEPAMAALVSERRQATLEQARQARFAHAITELRKAERVEQRAERELLRAWRHSDNLRTSLEAR